MVAKELHRALCRGYLSLAAAHRVAIWRYEPLHCYVLEFPAGIVTFPMALIGDLAVSDYQGTIDRVTLEELQKRLEDPLNFPLPDKEKS